jgi:hypothetical protein
LILGGYWLDRRHGVGWRWTITGLVLAILYSAYETWKLTRILREQPNGRSPGRRDKGSFPTPTP